MHKKTAQLKWKGNAMKQKSGEIIILVSAVVFLFGGMWIGKQNGMKEYENKVELNTKRILEQFPNQDDAFFQLTNNFGVLTDQGKIELRKWTTKKFEMEEGLMAPAGLPDDSSKKE